MNSYSIIISGQEELDENWQDERCPNFGFRYDQIEISECFQNDDGTYVATYTSLTVSEPTDFTYLDMLNGGTITYTLPPGEYGIKANSQRRI